MIVQAIDSETIFMNDKELSDKLDKILVGQGDANVKLATLTAGMECLNKDVNEYKARVDRVEARQWKISSFTAAVGAFIAYLFKKQG